MKKRRLQHIGWLLTLAALTATCCLSCERDEWEHSLDGITFSCEEVTFDTIFVSSGSTTRYFMIYNRGDDNLRIDYVGLLHRMRGERSCFRINVDGDTAVMARNIEIAAGDSCFVFVQATIHPQSAEALFVETDTLVVSSGGRERRLPMRACGRNAVYHLPDHVLRLADSTYPTDNFGNRYRYSVIDCANWRHDLPHVIVGYAVVDAQQTLNLTAGDELYFHNDAVLWVYDSATLHVEGTPQQPVRFTSLRHDDRYDHLPGQWGYIWLSQGSHDNIIRHAVIENATVGLLVDTNVGNNPTLTISHCVLRHHALAGIIGQTAYIVGDDLLVHTCGTATLALQYGGRYEMEQSTFANYWAYGSRTNPSVIVNNHMEYDGVQYCYAMPLVRFSNCIVYGSRTSGEMLVDLVDGVESHLEIDHSIVRGGDWDIDPHFVDPWGGDYRLQEESPAEGLGYHFPDSTEVKRYAVPARIATPRLAPRRKVTLHQR